MGRLFAGILSFVVGVQFTIGTLPFSLSIQSAHAETCGADQKFDAVMGRCLSTAQASQVSQATAGCASAGDEAAQKKCYLNQAESALADAEANGDVKGEGKVKSDMMGMILTMGGLASSVGFLITGGNAKCGPFTTSAMIIAAASAAAFMGEVMSASAYKKKMKEANETLKKINEGSAATTKKGTQSSVVNATNVQQEAFNALIKKEEAVIGAANVKKKLYTLAMVGYAAATVMAGIEVAKSLIPGIGAAATACPPVDPPVEEPVKKMIAPDFLNAQVNDGTDLSNTYVDNFFKHNQRVSYKNYLTTAAIQNSKDLESFTANLMERNLLKKGFNQSLSLNDYSTISDGLKSLPKLEKEEFSIIKTLALIGEKIVPTAHASPLLMAGGTAATVFLATKVAAVSSGMKFLYTNPYARLALSALLTANAMRSKGQASKEAGKAKDRKAFLEKLRDQVAEGGPGLNCGSADISQASANCKSNNPESMTPDDASFNPGLASANFGLNPERADAILGTPKCITNTGSYDPNCSCKSKNTCLNISGGLSGSIPAGVSLGSVATDLDSINSGKLAAANLDEAKLMSAANRLNKLSQDIAKKNPSVAKANSDAKKKADEMNKQLSNQIGTSGGSLAALGSSGSDSLLNTNSPSEALEQLKNELKQEIGKVESTGSASSNPSGLDLSGLGGVAVEETPTLPGDSKLAEVMGSEFDMGNNDINTESSSNIFDIVSNRYRRSGIRRLLGAEQIIPSDKASTTDINK